MADGICTGCGATIEYSAGVQSLKCPYCGAVNNIARPEDVPPSVIEKIVPLAVTVEDLEKAAFAYMTNGDYTPDDMLEASVITQKERLYVPAYIFHVEYDASWTASFGYDRKEQYTDYQTVHRNGRSFKEPVTRTKTVTDWRPQNGRDIGRLELAIYAGKRLKSSALGPDDLVPYAVANGSPTAFNPSFLKGIDVEELSLPEAPAYSALKGEIDARIDRSVKNHGQGDHQKDWHWKADTSRSSATVYVPVCHIAFEYKGNEYHLWVDGVDAGDVRADKLPEDSDRKRQVKQGFIPVAVGVAGFALSSLVWSFAGAGLIAVGLAGAYGLLRRNALFEHSKKIRSSLLTQKNVSSSSRVLSEAEQDEVSKAYRTPEKAFFAKTHQDKKILPALTVAALVAAMLPGYQAFRPYVSESLAANAEVSAAEEAGAVSDGAEAAPADFQSIGPAAQAGAEGVPEVAPDAEQVAGAEAPTEGADGEVGGWSPSFDCAKASSSVEGMICGSRELSALDVQMAAAYKAAPASRELRATQVEWRKSARDACQEESCVAGAYKTRLEVLSAMSGAQATAAPAASGTNPVAIARMLQRAETALSERNYDDAISTSKNILLFDPSNGRAKEILETASRSSGPRW